MVNVARAACALIPFPLTPLNSFLYPNRVGVTLQGPGFTYTARSDFQGEDSFSIVVAGSINKIYGSSTIHVRVSVGTVPPTQENPAKKVESAKSAPTTRVGPTPFDNQTKTRFKWYPRIDNLTIIDWLTIALYFMASITCGILACRVGLEQPHWPRERGAWRSLAVLFLGLGINRQLNLDTVFTQAGRVLANYQGWYGHRALFQLAFIAQVALTCVVVEVTLLVWARRSPKSTRVALAGAVLVFSFVVIRAVSYHYVDRFLNKQILGFRRNSILEMAGIGLVLLASLWRQGLLTRRISFPARGKWG